LDGVSLSLADQIVSLGTAAGVTITTAESCTGGLVAAALTDAPGSSGIFDRGFVTYSNGAKIAMLEVRLATLSAFGAVSKEVAVEMADGARRQANADIAVSVTGIAGPGGSEHKPEGRVCFALAIRNQRTVAEQIDFGGLGRREVRQAATSHALKLIQSAIALV
jgi:nicotinamide-nucleotide amidase